jgi:hypothetical protein
MKLISGVVPEFSFELGETPPLRHPGSEPNEVKAMLSGIHSVTLW